MATTAFLSVSAFGYSDTFRRMVARKDATTALGRDLMREVGRIMVNHLRMHAPSQTGIFKSGIYYATYERPEGYSARFYVRGEHAFVLPFLLHGTSPHEIPTGGRAAQIAKGYPLRFFWEKGPTGAHIYFYWKVNHPGTNPSPFVSMAETTARPEIREKLRQVVKLAWL